MEFNGKTTYAYDSMNQLLSKTPDASFHAVPVTYSYSHGLRSGMTDASGSTGYFYSAARLQQVFKPAGALNYSYDLGNNLTQLSGGGMSVNYTYDALNRLVTVQENNTGTTSYGYDNVGNLQSVTYPNGVVHTYSYDTRNRLTNLGVAKGANNLAGYSYTLDAAGHRTSVTEQSGRTVNYSYDDLYRLTNETVGCSGVATPGCASGSVGYTYDAVGNRKQMTSTLPGVAAGLWNYDANDRFTAGDTYDANGNTISSGGIGNVYDFENHLIQKGGVTIVYDGDGNRVAKTVAGATTLYLVDTQNPTGYAQVIAEEFANTTNSAAYVYGLERISKAYYSDQFAGPRGFRFYVYDGHGSVRALTDPSGNVTDTYDYDAFGNLIHSTFTSVPPLASAVAPSPNNYLYSGEQFDPDLNLYYNRARYLNVSTGRFWTMDRFDGDDDDPPSLHKYTYTGNDPVNGHDATGFQTEVEQVTREAVDEVIRSIEWQLRLDRILRFARVATTGVVLLATALNLDGDNSPTPTPDTRDRTKKPKMLYRLGLDWEYASDLENQAQAAEAKGFPHGVSTLSKRPSSRTDVEEAPFDFVAAQFPVEKTGASPYHYTVVLPSPVTQDAATQFNGLWFPPRVQPR